MKKVYKFCFDYRITAKQIEDQEDVYAVYLEDKKICLTFNTQIEKNPEVWFPQE